MSFEGGKELVFESFLGIPMISASLSISVPICIVDETVPASSDDRRLIPLQKPHPSPPGSHLRAEYLGKGCANVRWFKALAPGCQCDGRKKIRFPVEVEGFCSGIKIEERPVSGGIGVGLGHGVQAAFFRCRVGQDQLFLPGRKSCDFPFQEFRLVQESDGQVYQSV
ncbi:MAG: hypothetical protein LBR80_13050 [Deltaproteobacteria bacterium]|nr:hypothetical protein [Deltaproteobacteria bacterium]